MKSDSNYFVRKMETSRTYNVQEALVDVLLILGSFMGHQCQCTRSIFCVVTIFTKEYSKVI